MHPTFWSLNRYTGNTSDGLPSCKFWAPANFGLPRPFRSRVRSRHAADRRKDIENHFIIPLLTEGGGQGIIIITKRNQMKQSTVVQTS